MDIVLRIKDTFLVKERGKVYSVISEMEGRVIRIGDILSDSQGNKFKITGLYNGGYQENRYEILLENMDGIEVQVAYLLSAPTSGGCATVEHILENSMKNIKS